ncbi:MAG TPA: enoyl-CoA hydratase/isomerase family protein, partial [Blastocatellia bacterium]|nr:enoyl-CoA hydratase/isomerase family protein [Blastocatellia bacterium]
MDYKTIIFEMSGRIATITLNRPDRLNAINEDMRDDFARLFVELQTNEEIGVVIITGAGRAFSAGGDIDYFEREWSTAKFRAENHRLTQFFDELELIEKPVIAAINGPCTGAGLQVTLSCDIRLASDQSKFGFRENNIGLIPG